MPETPPPSQPSRAASILSRCRALAACTEVPGETTRPFLAPSQHQVHALLRGWMETAGMTVAVDAVGNLRGVLAGAEGGRRLVIGSHLDTVPNAGAFDGVLGVVLGLAVVEAVRDAPLPFSIEVVGFSEEEGVRFAKPFLGSLAFAGEFDPHLLERTDAAGVSIEAAIREFGLDPAEIAAAAASDGAFGYLEVHIEQGPVLDSEGLSLGVVTGIAAQTRLEFKFSGQANHAGTTPMHLRRDAMAAAAAWIVAVEHYAEATPGLVATVGRVVTTPGVSNVITSEVTASLDVRHAHDAVLAAAVRHLAAAAHGASARGVHVTTRVILDQKGVATDAALTKMLAQAVERTAPGSPAKRMVSGAGHDAMIVARRMPVAVLFLRSPAGLSHHPEESVYEADVDAALSAAVEFVTLLTEKDGQPGEPLATTSGKEAHA